MKNQEVIKILKECYNGDFYYISIETGLEVIRLYIIEKKGFNIGNIQQPVDMFNLQLYSQAIEIIFNYYLAD